jgi:elongation factor G
MDLRPLPPDYAPLVIAIEPKLGVDLHRLIAALQRLDAEDPDFTFDIDLETRQCRLLGASDLQLDRKLQQLIHVEGFAINIGAPQVAYRETLRERVEVDYTHKHQSGPEGEFARVLIAFEPGDVGHGVGFGRVPAASLPAHFAAAVEKGVRSALTAGPRAGFPVIDTRVTLLDGAWHDTDSSALAFEIAARACCRKIPAGAVALLEPVARLEAMAGEDHVGLVVGDLSARRAVFLGQRAGKDGVIVDALVPVANLFNYFGNLQTMTGDKASARWQAVGLAAVPGDGDDPAFRPAMAVRA